MRIDRLRVRNFRCFDDRAFTFDSDFSVLIGRNGTGKTAALEALAVAVGSWLLGIPGYQSRGIQKEDIRWVPQFVGDQLTFEVAPDETRVEAEGAVGGQPVGWARSRRSAGKTRTAEANELRDLAGDAYRAVQRGESVTLPVLVYYGAGRLWQATRLPRERQELSRDERRRAEGYRSAIDPRCSPRTLQRWMRLQAQIRLEEEVETHGLRLVRRAMTTMTEGAEDVDYRGRWKDIVAFFGKDDTQPFGRLSAGQRNMLALAGDLAMRISRLNPHLEDRALDETPGVVLIDEIDLHLHPSWQRHIVDDLRRTFPKVQFIATTHSPFIVQSLQAGELIDLQEGAAPHPLPESYVDRSIEDISEDVMHVPLPQKSRRYLDMMQAAETYYERLRSDAPDHEVRAAKRRLDEASVPFGDDPAFQALLALERKKAAAG